MAETHVSVDALSLGYAPRLGSSRHTALAVQEVSLRIEPGESVALVGASGSGKSTLARAIMGLHRPSAGRIFYRGRDIYTLTRSELRSFRQDAQMVFQDVTSALDPRMRVFDLVGEGLRALRLGRGDDVRRRVFESLEAVALPIRLHDRYPHELSGGQRQRVGLARALAVNPRFLLADEPFSAQDVSTRAQLIELLGRLRTERLLTLVLVTHDLAAVAPLCDRAAVMSHGRIVEEAASSDPMSHHRHPYTRALYAAAMLANAGPSGLSPQPPSGPDSSTPVRKDGTEGGCFYAAACPIALPVCVSMRPALVGRSPGHTIACHGIAPMTASEQATGGVIK